MASETVSVRPARPADIDRLVDFNLAMAMETEKLALDRGLLRAGVQAVFESPARGFYLVAETEEAVAGCLMITFEWSDWRNADWWWIQSVYVAPAFRRRGVYRALHEEVIRRARAAGPVRGVRLYVERDNRPAQQAYCGLGMHQAHYLMFEQDFAAGQSDSRSSAAPA